MLMTIKRKSVMKPAVKASGMSFNRKGPADRKKNIQLIQHSCSLHTGLVNNTKNEINITLNSSQARVLLYHLQNKQSLEKNRQDK